MTTARDTVLGRIKDALALAPTPDTTVPRTYRTGRTLPDDERLALFTDRLVDYKAHVHTCTADRTAATVAEVLRERGARRIGVPAGLDPAWLGVYDGEVQQDSDTIPAPRLDALDGVVTASAVSCAETGTIFLDGSPDQGRRALSLVPDLHVCVVDLSSVEVGVPEAVARLVPERPTTLISGPSATSDIELERVEGVHGPRTLVVVIRTDA
ncbi:MULTISPECIES: LutC/YkgG family protein [unclassified Streptomyces]|uniref:LutC/YkgG family protein n=1 Tax=unclassified Streptomyces TaxID=2593676 RepID=UPI002258325B|nr:MULTISPECIES: LUD domain-containing protein [unclassified Streptomyces]WSP59177.1 LUD domain-containing protein [Streptomyces sp. NBC_01241]WSU20301.1 LUD domain-containing protein [Streptomyces sp. NBC_01108]MCX4790928.1 LUD domain-containing protein [Streptomyces sp. NBC_01221]MCX4793346.1 LUD domain-containing protein [Streptomyces sp. NBC_01242]WSJ34787.1 LUD domain-containing protein [Streptomyces sp. NBC_01321]